MSLQTRTVITAGEARITEIMLHTLPVSMMVSAEVVKGKGGTITLWQFNKGNYFPMLTISQTVFFSYHFNETGNPSYFLMAAGEIASKFDTYFFNINQIFKAHAQSNTSI